MKGIICIGTLNEGLRLELSKVNELYETGINILEEEWNQFENLVKIQVPDEVKIFFTITSELGFPFDLVDSVHEMNNYENFLNSLGVGHIIKNLPFFPLAYVGNGDLFMFNLSEKQVYYYYHDSDELEKNHDSLLGWVSQLNDFL